MNAKGQRRGRSERGLARTIDVARVMMFREWRLRYRQSVFNVGWSVVTPLATLAVYGIVLTQSFDVASKCSSYLLSAWSGLVMWTFFASAVGGAVGSLISSSDMITKLWFPRESIPLAITGVAGIDLVVGLISVLALMLIQGGGPGLNLIWVFPSLALVAMWAAALSVVSAVVAGFSRDAIHGVHLFLRLGFFATPVMYEVDFLPRSFAWSAKLNPIAVSITEFRNAALCNTGPSLRLLAAHLLVAAGALSAAILYTRRVESRLVDVI